MKITVLTQGYAAKIHTYGYCETYWHEHFYFLMKNKKEKERIYSHLI